MKQEEYLATTMDEVSREIFEELVQKDGEPRIETITPVLIFRKILQKFDTIRILNEAGGGEEALALSRIVLENYWYLMFILEEDTAFRSLSYYYFDKKLFAEKYLKQVDYFQKHYHEWKKQAEDNHEYASLVKKEP
ncbi:hypothetical protein GLW04_08690 [Halobacillus litoralis]|uniref:Uncharacterized protein n=1 Tax=Halobacillus litoralis TaxID=45668 RepID=A0A845DQT5_9BACI|nr:DUF5677 domain-containing protein [Halobacillus litoralis]MYL19961.1 hypothetical protein [Halobacillus litoralis]